MVDREELRDKIIPEMTIVEYALLCDQVLFEIGGMPSFIRVINRIFPRERDELVVNKTLHVAIALIEGKDEELLPHTIRVDLIFPDGQTREGVIHEFEFPRRLAHMFHFFEVEFGTDQHGLHVFEIHVNGRRSKRVFLQSILPAQLSLEDRHELFGFDPLDPSDQHGSVENSAPAS